MRTRSKPVSPGGLVSLDDIPPRPCRATRSVSAQPQGPEPAEPAKKTRARKGSRAKKVVTRAAEDENPVAPGQDGQTEKKSRSADDPDCNSEHDDPSPAPFPSIESLFTERVGGPVQNNFRSRSESDSPSRLTPRRNPSSYSDIARRRQNEAGGQVEKTLYRLNSLVAQNEVDVEASAPDHQQAVTNDVVAPVIADPTTPERQHASPSTPVTAPALGSDAPSTWSNWAFDNVTRRWVTLWDRFSRSNPDAQPAAQNTTSPAALTKSDSPTQPAQPAKPAPAESFAQPVQTAPYEPYRRRSSISLLIRQQRKARPARPPPRKHTLPQMQHPRRGPITKRKYDYSTHVPYRKELLDKYLQMGLAASKKPDPAPPAPQVSSSPVSLPPVSTPQVSQNAEPDAVNLTNLGKGKRKRQEPEVIPNPPGVSYGFDPDYFIIPSDDEEEAERDKARRAAAAAKKAQKLAEQHAAQNDDTEVELPAAKRARLPEPHRRRSSTRPATGNATTTSSNRIRGAPPPASLVSPSQRPGFIPNRRQTYQFPDLSPIDSSGLLCDSPETSGPETSGPLTSTPEVCMDSVSEPTVSMPSMPLVSEPAFSMPQPIPPVSAPEVHQASGNSDLDQESATTTHAEDGFSPLTRARNKAEQFKPKTPSRLRETHRFSSNLSTPRSLFGLSSPAGGDTSTFGRIARSVDSSMLEGPSRWLFDMCPNGDLDQLAWPPRVTVRPQPLVAAQLPPGSHEGIADEAVAFWRSMLRTEM